MADIFQEIDEELRQEKAEKYWQKYGTYVIIAALAIVIAVSGNVYWKKYQADRKAEQAELFTSAVAKIDGEDKEAALAALAAVRSNSDAGYAALAQLREAALLAEQGDVGAAVTTYNAIADDEASPKLFRDVATLLAVLNDIDTGDAAALSARLDPLAAAGQPWRPMALEMQALLAVKSGKTDDAQKLYQTLLDDSATPAGTRTRAAEMIQAILG